jgi:predicted neuraminidase
MNDATTKPGLLHAAADDPARIEADLPTPCIQNHAANLMALADGDLGCVWFGGTQEGVADISILFSRLPRGASEWTAPVRLSDDPTRSEQNPILFPAPDGRLWLLHTAQKSGNQDTAIVRYRISEDGGRTWGPPAALFDEQGVFVRHPLVVLDNGDWLLPAYHCRTEPGVKWVGDNDESVVRITTDQGRRWFEVPVPESTGCVHMSIVKGRRGLLGFFRSRWADSIYISRSSDNGRTWTKPVPTTLPNNNSSIQATRLANGHIAMIYNDIRAGETTERRVSLYDEIEDEEMSFPRRVPGPSDKEGLISRGREPSDVEVSAKERGTTLDSRFRGNDKRAFWGTPRAPMTVAISADDGETWPWKRNLEVGDGYCMTNNSADRRNREYSYPTILQTADGAIHIAYTVWRQKIRYVRIDEKWVTG